MNKDWHERPVGLVVLGIVITVVGGVILWAVLLPFDKAPSPPYTTSTSAQKPVEPPPKEPTSEVPPAKSSPHTGMSRKTPVRPTTTINAQGGIAIVDNNGIVDHPTVNNNYGPPEPKVSWKTVEGEFVHNSVMLEVSVDHSMELPAFVAYCDQPCESSEVRLIGQYLKKDFGNTDNRYVAWMVLLQPRPLGAGVPVNWRITPKEDKPLRILSVRKMTPDEVAMLPEGDR